MVASTVQVSPNARHKEADNLILSKSSRKPLKRANSLPHKQSCTTDHTGPDPPHTVDSFRGRNPSNPYQSYIPQLCILLKQPSECVNVTEGKGVYRLSRKPSNDC